MLGALLSLVIYLVICGLIYWAVTTILAVIPLPEPIRTVINVIMIVVLVLICIYALLSLIGLVSPGVAVHSPVFIR